MNTVKLIRARLFVLLFILTLILSAAPVVLATKTPAPVFNPELTVAKTAKAIKVDGNISPAEWAGAAEISNFVERYPGENTQPAVATQTFVTYDRDNLYVAFVCHDDPASIRATMCQRDQFNGDDDVCVLIDTYGKAAWAYELLVNPYGVQKDRLWTQVAGEDSGFDMVWASAAKVTDSGYQVEIAVPFSSMRFPNQSPQSWKMDFWRNRPRQSSHQYSWAAYNRNEQCWPCQWGEVNGIGDVNPGKGMEILPTYVAHQAGYLNDGGDPTSGFHEGDVSGELSLGAKYSISSNATLEGAYNPDFSQIESDAAQVDVNSTIALFYPERRPFFQEGSDIFRTLFNSFYTRTVNDPQYATKFITRTSDYSIGFMSAEDKNTPYLLPLEERSVLFNSGKSYVNVLRGSRAIGAESRMGFILTDRRLDGGGYGTIASVDGRFRLTQQYSVLGQFISSFTGEPDKAGPSAGLEGVKIDRGKRTAIFDGESFHGNALITQLRRQAREWSFTIDYDQVEPSYRTLTGYDPWVDYRNTFVGTQYTFYPTKGLFQRIQPSINVDGRWLFDGTRRWEHQYLNLYTQLRWAQTEASISVSRGSESWTSGYSGNLIEYNGLVSVGFNADGQFSNALGYQFNLQRSKDVARFAEAEGLQNSVEVSLGIKPVDRLLIEPDVNYVRSTHADKGNELYRQFIFHTRLSMQLNRQLSLRLVLQYNDSRAAIYTGEDTQGPTYYHALNKSWAVDPLLTYRISSFSVLYAGATHQYDFFPMNDQFNSQWRLGSRQFFLKLQYLFQA